MKAVRDVAESEGIPMLRIIYEEAITQFCDELDAGLEIQTWPSSRPGMSKAKETVRMPSDVMDRMNRTARQHETRKGVFFRVALIRWLSRHGIDYNL